MNGEPETPKASKGWKRILGKAVRIFMITLVLIFLMGFIGVTFPIEIAFHLIAGPFIHAWKNLPPFVLQWRSSLLPLACLAVAILLAHRFICWWITSKDIRMSWRWGHTAAAVLLLLLGSAAAIAMSGITHQAAWLFSSPWLEDSSNKTRSKSRLAATMHDARQIMLVLNEYKAEHGRYPDTLDEAVKALDVSPKMLWVEAGLGRPRELFILLKPGLVPTKMVEPVLISPPIQPDNKVAVGYSDTSVRIMPLKAWQKLAKEIQTTDE
jgi:hypothetical protein